MEFYGINLISEDCVNSAHVYSEIFEFKILRKGEKHAEIQSNSGLRILFSPNEKHCLVSPGSFTVQGNPSEKFLESDFFQLEQSFPEHKYHSFLDKYGNRIWFLLS
jgi:hypothetical protein